MKKMCTLLFTLALSIAIFGQGQAPSLLSKSKNGFRENIEKRHQIHRKGYKPENRIKSSALIVMRLDSLIFQQEPFVPSILENYSKQAYTYSNTGEVLTEIYSTWGGALGWIPEDKIAYTYGTGAKVLEEEWFIWDAGLSQWEATYKDVYTYDPNGKILNILSLNWESSLSQWVNSNKQEFSYNTASELIQMVELFWDQFATTWVNGSRYSYTYLANGLLHERIEADWDPFASLWNNARKEVHDYNLNGDPVTITEYSYDEMSTQWVPFYKQEMLYNTAGKRIQMVESYYDIFMLQWTYNWKEEYQWASNGDLDEVHYFIYESSISTWLSSSKEEMTYDTLFGYWDILIPEMYRQELGHYFNHMLLQLDGKSFDGSNWYTDYLIDLYYSPMNITGLPETEKIQVSIFPNPSSGLLRVEFSNHAGQGQMEILDNQGRLVMNTTVSNHSELDISALQSGLYFYRISTNQTRISGKLIKQ